MKSVVSAAVSSTQMGWLRHVLIVLSVVIFVLGCFVIGYMSWVLASSVTISRFADGSLVFTYVVISLGFLLFFSGLLGWVGGAAASNCVVAIFLLSLVLSIFAEIGGIISLNVVKLEFGDILQNGWEEVNQETRNLIQTNLDCCGWEGGGSAKDMAFNSEAVDESCYREEVGEEERLAPAAKKLRPDGCGVKLYIWFEENKVGWVTALASMVAVQIMCVGIAAFILSRVRRMNRLKKSRNSTSKRRLDSASSTTSLSADLGGKDYPRK